MACESTQLILIVLTSCLANSSISTSLFWRSPKPSWNIKLPLQLVPSAHPPHQVSILVSRDPFAQSNFLLCPFFFLSNLSIAMFQIYYHGLFAFSIIHYPLFPYYLTFWVFITHQYWSFSAVQLSSCRGLLHSFNEISNCFHASYWLCTQLLCLPHQTQGHPWHLPDLACTLHPPPLLLHCVERVWQGSCG